MVYTVCTLVDNRTFDLISSLFLYTVTNLTYVFFMFPNVLLTINIWIPKLDVGEGRDLLGIDRSDSYMGG